MDEPKSGIYSVLIDAWLIPIGILWNELSKSKMRTANEVQTSAPENGNSSAIIVLSIHLLESALHRTFCVLKDTTKLRDAKENGRSMSKFFKNQFTIADFSNENERAVYCDELMELFAIRNALAHNHIWKATIEHKESELSFVGGPEMLGYSSKDFDARYDRTTRKTKRLGLNIFPRRVDREDARITIITVYKILRFLENKNKDFISTAPLRIRIGNRRISLEDFICELGDSSYSPSSEK